VWFRCLICCRTGYGSGQAACGSDVLSVAGLDMVLDKLRVVQMSYLLQDWIWLWISCVWFRCLICCRTGYGSG
jgi:hypothetical protein